jgi:hypothetical protein
MATQQFGYGPNVWAPAKGTGAIEIPQLAQPGGAKPEFKPQNEYAALAAKMVGELAYGAMAEEMAPEYVGYNEVLGKHVYRIKPGSAQFAPEGGWMLPDSDSIWERDLGRLLKQHEISEQEKIVAEQADMRAESEAENVRKMELEAYGGPRNEYYDALAAGESPFSSSLTEALEPTTVPAYDWSQHDLTDINLDTSGLPMPELTHDGKAALEGGKWVWKQDKTDIGGFGKHEDGLYIPIPGFVGGRIPIPGTGTEVGKWGWVNPSDPDRDKPRTHISQL